MAKEVFGGQVGRDGMYELKRPLAVGIETRTRRTRTMGLIVVGVDHSAGAKAALRFALDEARLRRSKVRAVHAWHINYVGAGYLAISQPVLDAEGYQIREAAEAALEATLDEVLSDDVEIERRVVEGPPASVLVDESRAADLLVVGSRGHGGFTGLLLGSVSQQCAQHAECPVVIVRAPSGTSE
jgi:nucleotide-binding universal stress UspA family protein